MRDRTGRTRYVVFEVEEGAPWSRGQAGRLLPEGVKLTRFDGRFGIARTTHDRQAEVVAALQAAPGVRTRAVSGTIRAAARRLPPGADAAQRGPRPPRK